MTYFSLERCLNFCIHNFEYECTYIGVHPSATTLSEWIGINYLSSLSPLGGVRNLDASPASHLFFPWKRTHDTDTTGNKEVDSYMNIPSPGERQGEMESRYISNEDSGTGRDAFVKVISETFLFPSPCQSCLGRETRIHTERKRKRTLGCWMDDQKAPSSERGERERKKRVVVDHRWNDTWPSHYLTCWKVETCFFLPFFFVLWSITIHGALPPMSPSLFFFFLVTSWIKSSLSFSLYYSFPWLSKVSRTSFSRALPFTLSLTESCHLTFSQPFPSLTWIDQPFFLSFFCFFVSKNTKSKFKKIK